MDRDRLLNDLLNTGVTAALIGGFALSNIQGMVVEEDNALLQAAYLLSFGAVHACTCACLTSAMLYREANKLSDEAAEAWASSNTMMLSLPWYKFAMGCFSYIVGVVLMTLDVLEDVAFSKWLSLVIGIMSCSTVFMTQAGIIKSKSALTVKA
jgi:hypothetical protein